jgi:hypothetical protein
MKQSRRSPPPEQPSALNVLYSPTFFIKGVVHTKADKVNMLLVTISRAMQEGNHIQRTFLE